MTLPREVLVALTAGAFQVAVALVALFGTLATAGDHGASPIDVDADARRCGIDRDALRTMR